LTIGGHGQQSPFQFNSNSCAFKSFALDQSTLIYFVRPQINRVFRSSVTCMTDGGNQEPVWKLSEATIDLAIRFGIIALLGYWSAHVISRS